jgi:hypothetical protein
MKALNETRRETQFYLNLLNRISGNLKSNHTDDDLAAIMKEYQQYRPSNAKIEETRYVTDLDINNDRWNSLLREKEGEIELLKDSLIKIQQQKTQGSSVASDQTIKVLKSEIDSLRK